MDSVKKHKIDDCFQHVAMGLIFKIIAIDQSKYIKNSVRYKLAAINDRTYLFPDFWADDQNLNTNFNKLGPSANILFSNKA